jgi:hypothetical protein
MSISAHGSPLLSASGFSGLEDWQDFPAPFFTTNSPPKKYRKKIPQRHFPSFNPKKSQKSHEPKIVISAHGSPLLSESGFTGFKDFQDFFPPPT